MKNFEEEIHCQNRTGNQTQNHTLQKIEGFATKNACNTNQTFISKSIKQVDRIIKIPETCRFLELSLFRFQDILDIFNTNPPGSGEHNLSISLAALNRNCTNIYRSKLQAGSVLNITKNFYPIFTNIADDPNSDQFWTILEN